MDNATPTENSSPFRSLVSDREEANGILPVLESAASSIVQQGAGLGRFVHSNQSANDFLAMASQSMGQNAHLPLPTDDPDEMDDTFLASLDESHDMEQGGSGAEPFLRDIHSLTDRVKEQLKMRARSFTMPPLFGGRHVRAVEGAHLPADQHRRAVQSRRDQQDGSLRRGTAASLMEEQELTPLEELPNIVHATASSFRIPYFALQRDESDKRPVPVIFALITPHIVDSDALTSRSATQVTGVTFTIELAYGPVKWIIHRRLIDFFKLHSILTLRHLQGHIPRLPRFPSQSAYLLDKLRFVSQLSHLSQSERSQRRDTIARQHRQALEVYLKTLLLTMNLNVVTEICEFLECSTVSIQRHVGWKGKEGYLQNRSFIIKHSSCAPLNWWYRHHKTFVPYWFFIRDSFVAYVSGIESKQPREVLLCDKYFRVEEHREHGPLQRHQLVIANATRRVEVRPGSDRMRNEWLRDLHLLVQNSEWCKEQPHDSFCPVREKVPIRFLIDGEVYFEQVALALDAAKEEIFLHDWWLSPELYLRRPPAQHREWRLDAVLQRKAEQGVRIYVIVFKELTISLPNNSLHTKLTLEKLHSNVKVLRYPDHYSSGPSLWSHHEKLVIVDQSVAFLGGLDLCYGRFDTTRHSMADSDAQIWPGMDYSNPRVRDFRQVQLHHSDLIDRNQVPRMPWHDVQVQVCGDTARDTARHFIQRWNFIKTQKAMERDQIPFLLPRPKLGEDEKTDLYRHFSTFHQCRVQLLRSACEWSLGCAPERSIYDAMLFHIHAAEKFVWIENQFFISSTGSDPTTPVRNRIAQALVERILKAARDNVPFRVYVFMPLMPAFEADVDASEASSVRVVMQAQFNTISRGPHSILGRLTEAGLKASDYVAFYALRSVDELQGRFVTEQLYIHSKLMIVDDRVAIIGSANINDRSLLGVRDSEIAALIEEDHCNGAIRQFRQDLLCEHLALEDPSLIAEIMSDVWGTLASTLQQQAFKNTQLYRTLFRCIPDDTISTWEEYRRFVSTTERAPVRGRAATPMRSETPRLSQPATPRNSSKKAPNDDEQSNGLLETTPDPLETTSTSPMPSSSTATVTQDLDNQVFIRELVQQIRGNIVQFPAWFMKNEDLGRTVLSAEFLLPVEVKTFKLPAQAFNMMMGDSTQGRLMESNASTSNEASKQNNGEHLLTLEQVLHTKQQVSENNSAPSETTSSAFHAPLGNHASGYQVDHNISADHHHHGMHDNEDHYGFEDEGSDDDMIGLNKTRAPFVSSWLETHYEAYEGVSLPRSTLYSHYIDQCRLANVEPVNAASFGKIIRAVFPNLKTRRLGTRGNSKYHYYGIKLKGDLLNGMLPEGHVATKGPSENKSTPAKQRGMHGKKRSDLSMHDHLAFEDVMGGPSRRNNEKDMALATNEEFINLLREHCNPIPVNVPPHIPFEALQEFCALYREHCQRLLGMVAMKEFFPIEMTLKLFWQGLPPQIVSNLNCEEACRIIGLTDDLLHQAITQIVMVNVLEPIPISLTQSIRHFAKHLESWLLSALDGAPMAVVDIKIDSAKRFTQILRRRTSLNHLAQAARTVLQNPEQVAQMLHDWNQVDFEGVKEQASWIVICRENLIESVENSFRAYLKQGVSLEFWAEWLEGIVDQCLMAEAGENEHPNIIESAARQFLLKWSFISTLIMRDLTLRSASSFGSFHLMRLLYDEYIFYVIERKLDEMKRRVMEEHWNQEAMLTAQATGEVAFMHGSFQNPTVPMAYPGVDQNFNQMYFPTDVAVAAAAAAAAATNPQQYAASERHLQNATSSTGHMSHLLHDINTAGSESAALPSSQTAAAANDVQSLTIDEQKSTLSVNEATEPQTAEQGTGYPQPKKKIRVDSSLAAILNC